jgi:hypothetical protein
MANKTELYGLRPVRQLNGSPFINAQNRYRIAADYGVSIYQGDLVEPTTGGTIAKHSGGTSGQVVGVFNGCFYTDPTTQKPTFKNYYPASTNASDIVAYVIDAPDTVFEMNSNLSFTNGVADLFQNYSVTDTTGNTATGISYAQLDVGSSGVAGTFVVQAIDISQNPDNQDLTVSNIGVLVRINNHFYRQSGTGK